MSTRTNSQLNSRSAKQNNKMLTSKQSKKIKESIMESERTLIKYLDWKDSYFYKHWIVRHAEDNHKWENTELMNDEESDFLLKLIRNAKLKKNGIQVEDLLKMCPSMIRKCYNSIELIYKEVLTDIFWRVEYD